MLEPIQLTLGVRSLSWRLRVWATFGNVTDQRVVVPPQPGGVVDGVTDHVGMSFIPAVPGLPVQVETGGAFPYGVLLETDQLGRVVRHDGGAPVMRALQASIGPGEVVWAVFTGKH